MLLSLQEEIEKVQERRAQRERERAEQEEMQQLLQRERGMAEAMELEAKEEAVSSATCIAADVRSAASFPSSAHNCAWIKGCFDQCLPPVLVALSTNSPSCRC